MATSSTTSPARRPEAVTPGGTSTLAGAPVWAPVVRVTSMVPQPAGWLVCEPPDRPGPESLVVVGQAGWTVDTRPWGKVTPGAA